MGRRKFSSSWGVPWLGLPLGGVLAVVGALELARLVPAEAPGASAEASRIAAVEEVTPDDPASSRPADRSAHLRRNETLGSVLGDLGLDPADVHALATASSRYVDPRQLKVGTPWAAYLDDAGTVARFELVMAGRGELAVERSADGWEPSWREFRRETRTRAVRGVLDGSLEASMARAGAPPELAYLVADVLQWDLDFTRDLRHGDEFRVLFEEILVEGWEPRPDRVLGVRYASANGRALEAYAFRSGADDGYYDGEGRPLQKMFLRSPLPYSRVTSRFSSRRFHPVLGVYRPHYGVDYGAPVGTPVRVTASGTVQSAGWSGGGGKTVKVRHANGYLTAYLHLSRFASGVRSGTRVRQGDVIGYVGSTGLASGPHLDYRIQHEGRWIDPLKLKMHPAAPIEARHRQEFFAVRDAMRASLETGELYRAPTLRVARAEAASGESTAASRGIGTLR